METAKSHGTILKNDGVVSSIKGFRLRLTFKGISCTLYSADNHPSTPKRGQKRSP